MIEGRKARIRSDRRTSANERRDDDRRNATPKHVEVETVCRITEDPDRRGVWTRRNRILWNSGRYDMIVDSTVFVIRDDQERVGPAVSVVDQSVIELEKESLAVRDIDRCIVRRGDNIQIASSTRMVGVWLILNGSIVTRVPRLDKGILRKRLVVQVIQQSRRKRTEPGGFQRMRLWQWVRIRSPVTGVICRNVP